MSSESETVPLFARAAQLVVHHDPINAVAISDDGQLFASGGDDCLLLIFDAKSLRELKRFRVQSSVKAIAWHPGQPEFVTYGTASGTVSTLTHNAKAYFFKDYPQSQRSIPGAVHCLAVRFDSRFLAVGFHDEVAIVRAPSISSEECRLPRPPLVDDGPDITTAVQFHRTDPTIIFVSYQFGRVSAYTYSKNRAHQLWSIDHRCICGPAALSPTSKVLASASLNRGIMWLDINDQTTTSTMKSKTSAHSVEVAFLTTNVVVVGSETGAVEIMKSGKHNALQTLHHGKLVQPLAYWHDKTNGHHLIITGTSERYDDKGTLTIWKAQDGGNSSFIRWRTLGALIAVVLSAGAAIAHYSPEFPAGLVVNSTSPAWFRFQSTRGLPIDAKLKLSASVDTSAPPSLSLASLQLPETTWTEPSTAVDPASVMRSVNLETTVTTTMTETPSAPLLSLSSPSLQSSLVAPGTTPTEPSTVDPASIARSANLETTVTTMMTETPDPSVGTSIPGLLAAKENRGSTPLAEGVHGHYVDL